jgi:hypothetical protein
MLSKHERNHILGRFLVTAEESVSEAVRCRVARQACTAKRDRQGQRGNRESEVRLPHTCRGPALGADAASRGQEVRQQAGAFRA